MDSLKATKRKDNCPDVVAHDAHAEVHASGDNSAGALAGIPLFLQRRPAQGVVVRRQPLEDEDEEELSRLAGVISVQPALVIGRPDDGYEREADRVADIVTRITDAGVHYGSLENEEERLEATPLDASYVQRPTAQCEPKAHTTPDCARPNAALVRPAWQPPLGRSLDSSCVLSSIRSPSGGSPLPGPVRHNVELVLGADLRHVQVHSDNTATAAARALRAKAFTFQNHVWLGSGQTSQDVGLLAHEATHVAQQTAQMGHRSNDGQVSGMNGAYVQRTEESDLVSHHTTLWGNLDEQQLGRALLGRAQLGQYDFVRRTLDELGSTDRDDVACELMRQASDDTVNAFAQVSAGRRMLDRLYDELTSGNVSEEEGIQADRVLKVKAQAISIGEFEAGVETAKIFPYRLPGLTVIDDAPIIAERRAEGKIWVRQPARVLGTSKFREETRTLPTEVFIGGLQLPENEIIGVRMYDLGGDIHYRPALYLIQLANETTTTVYQKIGEASALGLTLGSGALLGTGARMAWGTRALLWADRAAFALGTVASVIREHRGWIIERFGESGKDFLEYVDKVNSAVMIYGGARALLGIGQLLNGLRRSYGNWRSAVRGAEGELSASERAAVDEISTQTDDFLDSVERLRRGEDVAGRAVPEVVPEEGVTGGARGAEPVPSREPGLEGRGYRPAAGERSMARAEWQKLNWERRVASKRADLVSPRRRTHILDGDSTGGGHGMGRGTPGASEWPIPDDEAIHWVSDVATDPSLRWVPAGSGPSSTGGYARFRVEGIRRVSTGQDLHIRVIVEPEGEGIVTGLPTNVPRNPP